MQNTIVQTNQPLPTDLKVASDFILHSHYTGETKGCSRF